MKHSFKSAALKLFAVVLIMSSFMVVSHASSSDRYTIVCTSYDDAAMTVTDEVLTYSSVELPFTVITTNVYGEKPKDFYVSETFILGNGCLTITKSSADTIYIDLYFPKDEPTPTPTPVATPKPTPTPTPSAKPHGLPFEKTRNYYTGTFSDVSSRDWFYDNVKAAYQLGLVNGNGDGKFLPHDNISVAETITTAARIHNIYYQNGEDFKLKSYDDNWYDPYVRYADANDINVYYNYNSAITREQFAHIMVSALPSSEIVSREFDIYFRDEEDIREKESVKHLAEAGIIGGYDNGTFAPNKKITRAEAAALIGRMVIPSLRLDAVTIPTKGDAPVNDGVYSVLISKSRISGSAKNESLDVGLLKEITFTQSQVEALKIGDVIKSERPATSIKVETLKYDSGILYLNTEGSAVLFYSPYEDNWILIGYDDKPYYKYDGYFDFKTNKNTVIKAYSYTDGKDVYLNSVAEYFSEINKTASSYVAYITIDDGYLKDVSFPYNP